MGIDSWMKMSVKAFKYSGGRYLDTIQNQMNAPKKAINMAKQTFKTSEKYLEDDIKKYLTRGLTSSSYFDILNASYQFSDLEKSILECLGANAEEIEKFTNKVIQEIEKN